MTLCHTGRKIKDKTLYLVMDNIIWKDVAGYEGKYQVNTQGLVKSVRRNKLRKLNTDKDGYLDLALHSKGEGVRYRIHRLVAEAFIPNPDNLPLVLHRNDVRDDNRVENLMWGTAKDNMDDMFSKGRDVIIGEKHWKAKITEQDVVAIRELRSSTGWGGRKISRHLGLPERAVDGVLYQNRWKHV